MASDDSSGESGAERSSQPDADLGKNLREIAPGLAAHLDEWIRAGDGNPSEARSIDSYLPRLIREARVELEKEKAELAMVLATPDDEAVLILNSLGIITGVCRHSAHILGRERRALIGMPIDAVLASSIKAIEVSATEMARAAQGERVQTFRTQKREDGSTFEARHTLVALVGPVGELSGFARRIQDVSERRLHELHIEVLTESVALLMRLRP